MKTFLVVFLSILIHLIAYLSLQNKTLTNQQNLDIKKETNGGSKIKYVKLNSKPPTIKPHNIKNPDLLKPKKNKSIKKNKIIEKPIQQIKKIIPKDFKKLDLLKPKRIKKVNKPQKLSQPIKKVISKPIKKPKKIPIDEITQSYIDLYGDEFKTYSKQTKIFLIKNIKDIGAITKIFLEYPYMSIQARQSGVCVVEFILYPDGLISDLKVIKTSKYFLLDDNTMETIEEAYSDYPRPPKPTIIRIYVKYELI